MAKKRNGGADGSMTITGHNADLGAFSARFNQPVDSSANYSDTVFESHHGAGILSVTIDAQGFQAFGATSTSPHPDAISADGAATTLTFASGCTLIGVVVISDMVLGHARKSGVSPFSVSGMNAGAFAFAWAES
jgi:hypothetical protein